MTGDPVQDEAYASLFRPEPVPAAPEAASDETGTAGRATATGRLFRSGGVPDGTDAIPALRPGQASRLRTVADRSVDRTPSEEPVTAARETPRRRRDAPRQSAEASARSGMPARGVLIIVIGVALLLGLADALLGGGLGWIWGAGLLAASVYAALRVRVGDGTFAVTAPALAALASVLTVAQLDAGGSGGSLFDRAVIAFFALGDNWAWILAATAACGAIVAVRTRRARR